MTSKEALEEIKDWVEYKDAYWATSKHFEKIEKDLIFLETIKKYCDIELFYAFAFNEYLLSFTDKTEPRNSFDTPIPREDAEKIMKYFDHLTAQDSIEGNSKDKEVYTT